MARPVVYGSLVGLDSLAEVGEEVQGERAPGGSLL